MESGLAGIKFATASAVLLSGLLAATGQASAADLSVAFTGNLIGAVTDAAGIPQMGATVQLLNRYERVLSKVITASDGRFVFAGLPNDIYGVRVSQPSFLPAFKDSISVKPGEDSYLQIHLATLFSNIQVSYKIPAGTMSNDWKWALRSATATRPVTRYLPELKPRQVKEPGDPREPVFTDTHALVRWNGGDSFLPGDGAGDLGPLFALSTNVFGKNQVQVAGSLTPLMQDLSPVSVRSLAAAFERHNENSFLNTPEVTVSVTQFNRFGVPFAGGPQGQPLRVMSASVYQVADPLDVLHLEYGASAESVTFVQGVGRISPYARATLSLSPKTQLVAAYSDGGSPDSLVSHAPAQVAEEALSPASDLAEAVDALGRLPLMSSRNATLALQRTQNYELGFNHHVGRRTYSLSAFREQVWNGQLLVGGNVSSINQGNLLFDGFSKTAAYDIGDYSRFGATASVTQQITNYIDVGVAYGRMGGFSNAETNQMFGPEAQPSWRTKLDDVAGAKVRALIPISGTRLTAGYGWMQTGAIIPVHVFVTQNNIVSPGLNFSLEQPIPSPFGLPGHMELTADLRNLLAQGYIPVGGNPMLVMQAPRAIRGGLNITF